MAVIGIAFLHGLAVFMAWAMSGGSKGVAGLAVVISGIVAVLKGQLVYLPFDLIGIGLAWALVSLMPDSQSATRGQSLEIDTPPETPRGAAQPVGQVIEAVRPAAPRPILRTVPPVPRLAQTARDLGMTEQELANFIDKAFDELKAASAALPDGTHTVDTSRCPTYRRLAALGKHPIIQRRLAQREARMREA